MEPASKAKTTIDYVDRVLKEECDAELASRFKFAWQKSKRAGTSRGSFFAFKSEY